MSSMDSTTFHIATKHLFRHLHEPGVLRKNPLVRRFFENQRANGFVDATSQHALERIHRLVREAADYFRDADFAAGEDDRALRTHAIIVGQCLGRRAIEDVAADLGISPGYLYRQRAEICQRVAEYVYTHGNDSKPASEYLVEIDEFRVRIDRVKRRATFGDARATFRDCDNLITMAPSALQKIEALRTSAVIATRFGDFDRAGDAYAAAQSVRDHDLHEIMAPLHRVADATIDLIGYELATCSANKPQALAMVQRATSLLEPAQTNATLQVREMYAESCASLGAAFWNAGETERGYDYITVAETELTRIRTASPQLRAQVIVILWKLRNYLLSGSKGWFPLSQRLRGLSEGFEYAYASGFMYEAVLALVALAECHSAAGNDAEALRMGRFAVTLAKQQPSVRTREQTALQVALTLLSTKYWEDGLALLPNRDECSATDAFHRELLSYFPIARALRLHRFRDAWTLSKIASDPKRYPHLSIRKQLAAAVAAHELDRPAEARKLVEAAVDAAEQLGLAMLMRDAYGAAAEITKDPRFKRQASEVARLLTA